MGEDGTCWAWGMNKDGQLGVGDKEEHIRPTRVLIPGKVGVLAAGDGHTCAVVDDGPSAGAFLVWGSNAEGQLGDGTCRCLCKCKCRRASPAKLIIDSCGRKEQMNSSNSLPCLRGPQSPGSRPGSRAYRHPLAACPRQTRPRRETLGR